MHAPTRATRTVPHAPRQIPALTITSDEPHPTKDAKGGQIWSYEPRDPARDKSTRLSAVLLLTENSSRQSLIDADADGGSPFTFDLLNRVLKMLTSDSADYSNDEILQISTLAVHMPPQGNLAEVADTLTEDQLKDYEFRDKATELLNQIARDEGRPSPWQMATDALESRLPVIQFFGEAERNLASEYDLVEVAASPPPALKHLASLAELDLQDLLREIQAHSIADVATRRNSANRRLLDIFQANWNQQGIAVQVDLQGTTLFIQATTPEDFGLSDIGERSDGLRWFAALLACSQGWANRPILLVDEIETHLHYDAQADLIGVLTRQNFTSKVIYTTHSFGCLPNDLGAGVRVVQPLDSATSRLENGFWKRGAGFSPLLSSMGAAAMSFTPTRHALIGEGPSDAILLPTLLRQASTGDDLGFHIAPGLSGVAAMSIGDLDTEAGRVGFIVDSDPGGHGVADKLRRGGIDAHRILVIEDSQFPDGLETEDLVDAEVYVAAVNEELRCWNEMGSNLTVQDLGQSLRTKRLETWCVSHSYSVPDKTAVAQRVVDASSERLILATSHQKLLRELLTQAKSILGLA